MRHRLLLLAAALPLLAAPTASAAPHVQSGTHGTAPATKPAAAPPTCDDITVKAPPGATVTTVDASRDPGGTFEYPAPLGTTGPPITVADVPAFCDVSITLTHGKPGDTELIELWLPESGWNGRFQALGGSGYAAGTFGLSFAQAVKAGYAVGSTDAGAVPVTGYTSPWALKDDGTVDQTLLKNFAERSSHELAVVGKAVVTTYYGTPASYSYWNGCSTGGRQGYMEAQRHPDDFDGIVANAPAISWDRFAVAALWPHVVMNQEKNPMAKCELDAFTAAAVEKCDPLDGVTDGVIGDPLDCSFDPRTLVGTTIDCDGQQVTITAKDATVVRKMWDGPTTTIGLPLWYGLPRGADLSALGGPDAFPVAGSWVQDFVARDRGLDLSKITYAQYTVLFLRSVLQYHWTIGSDQTDLSAFRSSGGKLLTWQGLADQLVPVGGTIRYYDTVAARSRGSVDDYYRLFLAPGVTHCQDGLGPVPTDPLAAMVSWVEDGVAPQTLPAATTRKDGTVVERNLCPYPAESRYRGHGDPDAAASYRCVTTSPRRSS
ncbi:tannase/feruloyl esterase family alpha/beta hydrolase [Cellulosimicrobium terreum]|nr:tannase/feruloyl esterase family alpha/beta hydrolase [Cellulosimicrobium terreum]